MSSSCQGAFFFFYNWRPNYKIGSIAFRKALWGFCHLMWGGGYILALYRDAPELITLCPYVIWKKQRGGNRSFLCLSLSLPPSFCVSSPSLVILGLSHSAGLTFLPASSCLQRFLHSHPWLVPPGAHFTVSAADFRGPGFLHTDNEAPVASEGSFAVLRFHLDYRQKAGVH